MDEFRMPDVQSMARDFGGLFTWAGSDSARRFCEQGQSVGKAFTEWSTEFNQFLSYRIARNRETLSRITNCGNFGDAFAIQTSWMQDAAEDYLKQLSRLVELNSSVLSHAAEAVTPTTAQSEKPHVAAARAPMKVQS